MIGLIPPVGYPVVTPTDGAASIAETLNYRGYASRAYASGTAALAAALVVARDSAPGVEAPEVILPAYGCPDLVAAAMYAGLRPVLVDTAPDFHGFDLDRLDAAINRQTIAVVAVNLLGVHERIGEIRERLSRMSQMVLLIEDNAQWLPEPVGAADVIRGDCCVLSFGRGKPLSLLGGGLLLQRETLAVDAPDAAPNPVNAHLLRLKVGTYNRLLTPAWFGLVSRVPGLKIGATELHPLDRLREMDSSRQRWLPANLERYLVRSRAAEAAIAALLAAREDLQDATALAPAGYGRLLRYPILALDRQTRDHWVHRLRQAGFGATAMYGRPLLGIDGVADRVTAADAMPNAARYANRLLTLPLQSGIDDRALARLVKLLA